MKTVFCAALLGVMTLTQEAIASGLKTHLWIGERVLEDIKESCNVSIAGVQTAIPDDVCRSLRAHPGAFLAGTLGPDLYPDLITGQVTTHPGIDSTDPDAIPSQQTPPAPSEMSTAPGCASGTSGWKTSDWLRHIYDNAQEGAELAFAAGYLVHAASDIFAHTLVNAYAGDTFSLTDEHNVEVRHTVIERYLDSKISLNPETIEMLKVPDEFVRNQLLFGPCIEAQAGQASVARHVAAMSRRRAEIEVIARETERIQDATEQQAEAAAHDALDAARDINADRQALQAAVSRVTALKEIQQSQLIRREQQQRTYLELKAGFDALSAVKRGIASTDQIRLAQDVRKALAADGAGPVGLPWALHEVQAELLEAVAKFEPFLATQRDIMTVRGDADRLTHQLTLNEDRLSQTSELKNRLARVATATEDLRSDARKWADAMDAAGTAYILMAHETGTALVAGRKPVAKAYQAWLKCHGLSFSRISYRITGKYCAARAKLQGLQENIDTAMREKLPGTASDLYISIANLKGKLDAYISENAQTAVLEQLKDAQHPTARLVALLANSKYATRERVRSEFSKPVKGRKDLVIFDDAATLLDLELQLQTPNWSPDRVPAIAHAVALSKMSLLNADGLRAMVRDLGGNNADVPISDTGPRYSVLYQTVRSIDGNHQWQQNGLPFWRSSGAVFPLAPACRRFGYGPSDGPGMGFPLYANPELRAAVFAKVFPTPVYGVLAQHMGGLPGASDAGTDRNPFPFADDLLFPMPTQPECPRAHAAEADPSRQ